MSKWEDTQVTRLQEVADEGTVSYSTVVELAEELQKSERSVAAKLRALGAEVEKKNAPTAKWDEALAATLANMIHDGKTDVEIAEALSKSVKQVRGKALSMGLMPDLVIVKQEKEPTAKTFNEEETALVREMAEAGEYIEDIATAVDKTVRQVRGKLLSLKLSAPQREKKEASKTKIYTDEVVEKVKAMVDGGSTAEDIAASLELNIVGLKSWLGRNGLRTPDMGTSKAPKYTEEDIETMRSIAENGGSVEDAASALDRTVQSIRVVAGRNKIQFEKAEAA